ncbi:hypothetical protein X777_01245 [Ooceraea biroi]|uniref:Uncharacterized protein n=1 Tax=Ooceraea biroi TaxID=2015173 RepID=A0A026WQR3_OOCBI|nr:hypothetical protein X777_01245 [Ooceraea biroi]
MREVPRVPGIDRRSLWIRLGDDDGDDDEDEEDGNENDDGTWITSSMCRERPPSRRDLFAPEGKERRRLPRVR